jgi:hypothetical protein
MTRAGFLLALPLLAACTPPPDLPPPSGPAGPTPALMPTEALVALVPGVPADPPAAAALEARAAALRARAEAVRAGAAVAPAPPPG